jgi:uncharacterized membrane protein
MLYTEGYNLYAAFVYSFILGLIVYGAWEKFKASRPSWQPRLWENQIGPMLIALFVVYTFYPVNLFTYLPFEPAVPHLAQIYSGVLIGATSHLEYVGIRNLGGFFEGLLGRASINTQSQG